MRKILVLMAFLLSSFALASTDDLQRLPESEVTVLKDTNSGNCQVVFIIEQLIFFDNSDDARNHCRNRHSRHGVTGRCFNREHSGLFEANFLFRGGFQGDDFGSVFNARRDFINSRRFYDSGFTHRSRYFDCFD